jgi:hypothetical protein
MNELIVSLNSIIAPIIGGLLASSNNVYPFWISTALVVFATILHIVMLTRVRKKA